MNPNEARAQFQADKVRFEQDGIFLPGVNSYTPEGWGKNFQLAMDAQNPLVTDPSAAIPAILTTTIDPEVIRVIYAPLAFADALGERRKGSWVDQTMMFPVVEATGEVSSYGDFNNNGRAGINLNWPAFQSYLFQTFIRYGELEMDRAALAKISYASELQTSAALVLNTFQNFSYAFGISGLQNYGILNNPYLSAALTPSTKAAGGTTWFTAGGAPNATANEVYNDIIALVMKIIAQTNGAVDYTTPMTLLVSPQSAGALLFANSFGLFVKALLKEGLPNLKIKIAPQYGVQSTTNPQGASASGNMIQLIVDSIQGQPVAYAAFNEKLRSHKLLPEASAWMQKQTSGTWGVILRQPIGVAQMVGV